MIRIALPFAALSLALAACSQQPASQAPAGDASSESPAPMPTATVTETATPPTDVGPTASPTAGEPSAQTIPAALRGRWALVPADCTSTRGDAKGLLTIDATSLRFYESRATLAKETARSDTMLRGQFEYSGEGMTWTRDETLSVAGAKLTRTQRGGDEPGSGGPFTYSRCPA